MSLGVGLYGLAIFGAWCLMAFACLWYLMRGASSD